MFEITPSSTADAAEVEALLDSAFGAGRKSKTSYRYRQGVPPVGALSHVARDGALLVGSIAYWPVVVGDRRMPALLLGPLAVHPDRQNLGIGRALVSHTLPIAAGLGYRLALLVGDPDYYRRFGFAVVKPEIVMPGENPARLQYRELVPGALDAFAGAIAPAKAPHGRAASAKEFRRASV